MTAAGRELSIAAQNLVEVWAVATRSEGSNGLGMTTEEAAAQIIRLKSLFKFLAETPAIYPVWGSLAIAHKVSGKTTHDARLVAAMRVHGETSILTFNKSDFARFPGIEVISPLDIAS